MLDIAVIRSSSTASWILAGLHQHQIFINGELDPWSTLSRGPSDISYLVPHGSHCVGLYGNPEMTDTVMPAARELQTKLIKIAAGWLNLNQQKNEESNTSEDELYQ